MYQLTGVYVKPKKIGKLSLTPTLYQTGLYINPGEYDPMLPVVVEHLVAEPNEDKQSGARRLTPVYTYGSTN